MAILANLSEFVSTFAVIKSITSLNLSIFNSVKIGNASGLLVISRSCSVGKMRWYKRSVFEVEAQLFSTKTEVKSINSYVPCYIRRWLYLLVLYSLVTIRK